MEKLKPHIIALRAHDMHHGLSRIQGGLINVYMSKTRQVGAAAQLCTILKDQETIHNYTQLLTAAGEIGIDDNLLEKSLTILEEIEFVRIQRNSLGGIKRIDVTIPMLRDSYKELGEIWEAKKPTEFERLGVQILDDLTVAPQKKREILSKYNLDSSKLQGITDIGFSASYIAQYTSRLDNEEVLYSPLHWDENPGAIELLMKKYRTLTIADALKKVRDRQGMPEDELEPGVLKEAIRLGCLPTPSVTSLKGEKRFVFTPLAQIEKFEKSILEKARAIIACVRYGETFGTITQIKDPIALLFALDLKGYLQPHTEILKQYEILRNLGVGRISPDSYHKDRYWFYLIDNDENKKALQIAIEMLTMGEQVKETVQHNSARQLLLPGLYLHPTAVRANIIRKEGIVYSTPTIEKVNDLIRGVLSEAIE